jgi:hypothetical protein
MDRPTKLVINCETKQQEVIELTDDEIAQLEADRVIAQAAQAEREAAEAARLAAKQSAMDKLTALGLTADEVAALLP